MEQELQEYANELAKIYEISKTKRLGYMPNIVKTMFVSKIKDDLYSKENDLFYDFSKDNKKDVNNSLDSWSKDGLLTLLSNTSQMLSNYFNNYKEAINASTYRSYEEKESLIKRKEQSIVKYIHILENYLDILTVENESNDDSIKFFSSVIMFTNTVKNLYSAKRLCDDTLVARLALILSSLQFLEVSDNFSKLSINQLLTKLEHEKSFFTDLYFDYFLDLENIRNELIKDKENKIYFLNILNMTYNHVYNHYFTKVTQEALEICKSQDLLPETLLYSNAVSKIIGYFTNKRVDTMKEAINLYFSETKQDEQFNKLQNEMQTKINYLEGELVKAKTDFSKKASIMADEYERLREAHNSLVDKHNSLVDKHNDLVNDHNDLVNKHNEVIDIAKDIKDSLN